MLAMTDDDRGAMVGGFGGGFGADPDGWNTQFGETPPSPIWIRSLVSRMWRQGVQRRDTQVRELWRLLRQQRRLGRRTTTRQFLSMTWRRGIPARDPRMRQFVQQLREWGMLPPRMYRPRPGYAAGMPAWYQRPPWWYSRVPGWYPRPASPMFRPGLPLPMVARATQAAINPVVRSTLGPGGLLPNVARLPGQALQTAASVATAPARFLRSLF